MKLIKISKMLYVLLVLITVSNTAPSATDPGSVEAINSASEDRRNIIGVEISTATDAQREAVKCKEKGVFVSTVIPKHPADVAGFKPNDIIIQINGHPVAEHHEAINIMNGLEAGRSYPFTVWRMGEKGTPGKLTISVLIEKVQEKAIGKIS